VSLGGIWLNHYLAIQREFLFRGLEKEQHGTLVRPPDVQAQPPGTSAIRPPDRAPGVSVPVSRKTVSSDWYRALFAILICPLVDIVVFSLPIFPKSDFRVVPGQSFVWFWIVQTAPWLYASCIIILLPVLVFFYRRVARNGVRLIFTVLTWSALSAVYFFLVWFFAYGGGVLENAINGLFSGCISGLVYWLITYMPHAKA